MDENSYIVERDRIIEEINVTFNGVSQRDGVGYYEAQTDTWASDEKTISRARSRDRQSKRWQDLDIDSAESLAGALAVTDRDGFYFLFPAFMVVSLKQKYGGEEIVHVLEKMRREQDPRIHGFKEKQKHTIAHCLQFLAAVEEWKFTDYPEYHHAEIALREHWGQFLK